MENNFAGGHLVIDVLVKDRNTINNEQSVKDYLDQITDLIGLTAIIPPHVFKFPFSNEKKRILQKIEKFCDIIPPELQQEIEFAKKLETDDCGVSGMVIFAESHASCHSWTERKLYGSDGGITIDVFSCNSLNATEVLQFTEKYFNAKKVNATYLKRYFGKPQKIEQFSFGE